MANTNEALVYGWSTQQLGATAGQTGYAQGGNAPASPAPSSALQVSAGLPNPATAEDVAGENSASATTQILYNPGYAATPANITPGPIAAPTVPTNGNGAVQNPSGLEAQVSITGGTLTAVAVAPNVNGAAGTYTTVGVGAGVYQVPGGGFIKLTGTVAPTWTWNAVN